ncbi:molybdenum ABC transporter ATP-binding protein [Cognatishimia sp. 1_MG-2023]|uniref:molybdenum ABC transporter ATP-binding protein n=1 Tax=Cognatishimia sp. 1_MG-2023 TaxID=3062642 RepID=UPI0026E48AC3|nr:molybdenum ABC transporter ATP-binding protein [Cognatishimia sp. 1_MG-2023]MDO6726351.1 molybdenum ABC transporter ATP-binding protein [Cognatishimia sp. 1_MG-2023]
MSLSIDIRHQLADFELDVAFDAPAGVTALFGASGAGKTTVINALSGLLRPDHGRISLDDQVFLDTAKGIDLRVQQRRLGYVFQDHRLFPHMRVARNLSYGQRMQGLPKDAAHEQRVIEMLGLSALLQRFPAALSGGEKQRVAIGRALLSKPRILLLDEPLASLDQARRQEILPYLERLRDEADLPILYVSHSVSEVARLATTVVILERGKMRRMGPVSEIFADPEAVGAIGVSALGAILKARVAHHHDDGLSELSTSCSKLFLPMVQTDVGSNVRIRIRAQDVMLSLTEPKDISALNILKGTITALQQGEGPGVLVQVKCGDDLLLARVTQRSAKAMALSLGQELFAVIKSVSVAQDDISAATL